MPTAFLLVPDSGLIGYVERDAPSEERLVVVAEGGHITRVTVAASERRLVRLPGTVPPCADAPSVQPLRTIGNGVRPFAAHGVQVRLRVATQGVEHLTGVLQGGGADAVIEFSQSNESLNRNYGRRTLMCWSWDISIWS